MNDKPRLRVLILHGASRSGPQAFRLLMRLRSRFVGDFHLDHFVHSLNAKHRPWEKEWLPCPAPAAEAFVLAVGPRDDFSPCLRRWLNGLPEGPQAPKRALVLMDEESGNDDELAVRRRSWLIGLADRKSMDFFSSSRARHAMFHPNFPVCPMVHPVSRIMGPAAGYALSPLGAVHHD